MYFKKSELSEHKRKTWISIRHFQVVYVCRSFCSSFEYKISVMIFFFLRVTPYHRSCLLLLRNEYNFGFVLSHFWFQFSVFFLKKKTVLLSLSIGRNSILYMCLESTLFCRFSIALEQRLKAAHSVIINFKDDRFFRMGIAPVRDITIFICVCIIMKNAQLYLRKKEEGKKRE